MFAFEQNGFQTRYSAAHGIALDPAPTSNPKQEVNVLERNDSLNQRNIWMETSEFSLPLIIKDLNPFFLPYREIFSLTFLNFYPINIISGRNFLEAIPQRPDKPRPKLHPLLNCRFMYFMFSVI